MNILFIHEVDWLDKVVFDIHSLAEALSLRGHRIYAIDYENNWRKNGIFDFGSLRTRQFNDVSRAFTGSAVSLRRPGFIKTPGLSRLSVALTSYREINRTVAREKIDAIVLYSVPTNGLQTIAIAKKYSIPVLFRSLDILNQLVPTPVLRPFTRFLEKKVYSSVDMILSLTPGLTEYVVSLGADESKVRLLLMPVDTDVFYPQVPSGDVLKKWGLTDEDKVILFMGTLFNFSGLDDFIPRFHQIIEKTPKAKLLIVGDGPQRSKLDRLISELNLQDRVIITGFEPYEMMPQYINLAAICINTFAVTNATRDIFPGKTVQFLACAKPLVATALPGMIAVIADENQGVVYSESPDDMVTEIISLINSPARSDRLGNAGWDYVNLAHSYKSIAAQLEELINEAIGHLSSLVP